MIVRHNFKFQEVQGFKYGYSLVGRPLLYTYMYYVDGLLIDTGQCHAQKTILADLDRLYVDQIFITHHHEDHTGNIEAIIRKHRCPVFGSKKCANIMKNPPAISLAQWYTWGRRGAFGNIIPVEKVLSTNSFNFQIIPIPGHAPDMAALFEADQGWLFSADLYINSYIAYFLHTESISQQIASIKKILKLDFNVMFCSHNPKWKEPKSSLNKKLKFLESSFYDVAELYHKGYSAKQIFRKLEWKENRLVKFVTAGDLSKMNMVQAIIRDIECGT